MPLRLMDAARRLLPGAGLSNNLASPRGRSRWHATKNTAGLALLREGVLASPSSCIAAWPEHGRVQGLTYASPLSGPLAWELGGLHIDDSVGPSVAAVLELVAGAVAQKGGRRLFLRVPAASPLVDSARRAGFFPAYQESLFVRREVSPAPVAGSGAQPINVRAYTSDDEANLFHLYCAAVPAPVRALIGMTRDEWLHAHPRSFGREWVLEQDGKLDAHFRQALRRGVLEGEMILHPDTGHLVEPVLDCALAEHRTAWQWLTPEYQPLLPGALAARGFQESAHFAILVRTLAATVPVPRATPAVEA